MRSFYLFLSIFSLFTINLQAQAIIDYYELLSNYDNDIKIHKISQEGEKWYTSNFDNKQVEIKVDTKNDFIELSDNETDGTFNMQLTLLKKSKNDIYITLVKNHMDKFIHGEVHILKYRNGRFIDITEQLIPEICFENFIDSDDFKNLKVNEKKEISSYFEIGYNIKDNGKTITAVLQKNILSDKCIKNEILTSDICNSLKKIKYSELTMKWDNKSSTFIIGSRK